LLRGLLERDRLTEPEPVVGLMSAPMVMLGEVTEQLVYWNIERVRFWKSEEEGPFIMTSMMASLMLSK